jgi:hypothetical protein
MSQENVEIVRANFDAWNALEPADVLLSRFPPGRRLPPARRTNPTRARSSVAMRYESSFPDSPMRSPK